MNILEVEAILSKYWKCETSVEEELLLRNFFASGNVPEHLEKYKSLFLFQKKQRNISLGEDFDKKILAVISQQEKGTDIPVFNKKKFFIRLVRVAAVALLCVTVGLGTAYLINEENEIHYTDTYTDPEDAFRVIHTAVFAVSNNLNEAQMEVLDALDDMEILHEVQSEVKVEKSVN